MVEDEEYFRMLKRMIKAGAVRAGGGDEIELAQFYEVKKCMEEMFRNAVLAQLRNGKSWTDIGLALGVSRQAAFKRFR